MKKTLRSLMFIWTTLFLCASLAFAADQNGNKAEATVFTKLLQFSEGLAGVAVKGQWGFADAAGQIVIKAIYNEVRAFHEGYAPVRLEKRWGFIDHTGKYVINPQYDDARPFSEGLAPVKKGSLWGFIDMKGKLVMDYSFEDLKCFGNGLAPAKRTGMWGYINKKGAFVLQRSYPDAGEFAEGLAPVKTDEGQWGYIDTKGKFAVTAQFDDAGSFSDGLAPVKEETEWGYIDRKGKFQINPQYEAARTFSEKLAAVKFQGQWGYVAEDGRTAVPFSFKTAGDYSGGIALVSGGKYDESFYIDTKGNKTGPAGFTPMSQTCNDFYIYNQSSVPVTVQLTKIKKGEYGDFDAPSFIQGGGGTTATLQPGSKAEVEFRLSNIGKTYNFNIVYTFQGNGWTCTYTQNVADSNAPDYNTSQGGSCTSGAYAAYITKIKYQGTSEFDADTVAEDLVKSVGLDPNGVIGKIVKDLVSKALGKYMGDINFTYNDFIVVLSDNTSVTGACCLGAANCQMTTLNDCANQGGRFQEGVNVCDVTTCRPTGTCVLPSGVCTGTMTQLDCSNAKGTYQIGGTCPQGACNLPDGSCTSVTQDDCNNAKGKFVGGACPKGSCFLPDGTCKLITQDDCKSAGGTYKGDPACPASGACCNTSTGSCSVVLQTACTSPTSQFSPNQTCNQTLCSNTQVCCGAAGTSACAMISPDICQNSGGRVMAAGYTCSQAEVCALGGCCYKKDGKQQCADGMITVEECSEKHHGNYLGPGIPCTSGNCN